MHKSSVLVPSALVRWLPSSWLPSASALQRLLQLPSQLPPVLLPATLLLCCVGLLGAWWDRRRALLGLFVPTSALLQIPLAACLAYSSGNCPVAFVPHLLRAAPFEVALLVGASGTAMTARTAILRVTLASLCVLATGSRSSTGQLLGQLILGLSIGFCYAWAAEEPVPAPKVRIEEPKKKTPEQEKWAAEHAERERRAGLSLLENLRLIVKTPTARLPVAIDFPRLAIKMEIIDQSGQVIVPLEQEAAPAEKRMRQVLLAMMVALEGPERAATLDARYLQFFVPGTEGTKGLDQLLAALIATPELGPDSRPVRVLRACNQGTISTAVLVLKKAVGMRLPYKDIRGEWWIHVKIASEGVEVTHIKREQSWNTKPGSEFQFTWALTLHMTPDACDLVDVALRVVELRFAECAPEAQRTAVREILSPFWGPFVCNPLPPYSSMLFPHSNFPAPGTLVSAPTTPAMCPSPGLRSSGVLTPTAVRTSAPGEVAVASVVPPSPLRPSASPGL